MAMGGHQPAPSRCQVPPSSMATIISACSLRERLMVLKEISSFDNWNALSVPRKSSDLAYEVFDVQLT